MESTSDEGDESAPLVAAGPNGPISCVTLRWAAKATALALASGGLLYPALAPQLHRSSGKVPMAASVSEALGLAATGSSASSTSQVASAHSRHGDTAHPAASSTTSRAVAAASTTAEQVRTVLTTTTPEVCEDTPGWTNGYTACNNYNPVDPDCTPSGVTCHFYKRKPKFCRTGMNNPWQHCCACGGGSTFNGRAPTTTEVSFHLPHIPGMPHLKMLQHLHMPKWEKKLSHKLGKMQQTIEKKVKPVEAAVDEMYDGMNRADFNKPPKLGGNSIERINRTALNVGILIVTVCSFGVLLDPCFSSWLRAGRPRLWSSSLLVASYALLIPGLWSIIVSFDIIVNVVGHRINVQPDESQDTCTESVYGLINLLYKTGSTTGAVLIFTYAVVVPVIKLILLALGEGLRYSTSSHGMMISGNSIRFVQYISKWASPDMFAYIFLVHLIRDLEHKPLILTAARLDEGFTCFSVFCVCSTISSLGIGIPKQPRDSNDEATRRPPFLLCCAGRGLSVLVVVALTAIFGMLFYKGMHMPCMSLRIDQSRLYPPRGPLPYKAKPVVEALAIPELLKSDISLWKCILFLAGEMFSGEANSVLALALWAIFVVGFTILDMIVLVLATLRLRWPAGTIEGRDRRTGCGPGLLGPCPFMSTASVLRKLSMLDVSLMGVLVMCFSLQMYKKDGIVVDWEKGLLVLGAAESIHTLTYFLVSSAVEHAVTQDTLLAESEEPAQIPCAFGPCACARMRPPDDEGDDDPSVPSNFMGWACCAAKKRSSDLMFFWGSSRTSPAESVNWSKPDMAKTKRVLA